MPGGSSSGGPDGEPIPPAVEDAYNALAAGRCAEALDIARVLPRRQRVLYRGAARACLAAFGGQPHLWAGATADRDALRGDTDRECFEQDVFRLLDNLVETHRLHPTATIVRHPTGSVNASSCPRITAVLPDHGPPQGGQRARLIGANLDGDVYVHFGDELLGPLRAQGGEVSVTVPPRAPGGPRVVEIWASGWLWDPLVSFTYDRRRGESAAGSRMPV